MFLVTPEAKLIICNFQFLADRTMVLKEVVSSEQQNRAPTEIFAETQIHAMHDIRLYSLWFVS